MRRQFADYDRDGDGLVSLEEAHGVLQRQLGDRGHVCEQLAQG